MNKNITFNGGKLPEYSLTKLDLHGCTLKEAKSELDMFLDSAPRGNISVTIIHGCNRGNSLGDYVRNRYNHKRIMRKILGLNSGSTELLLK